MQQCADDNVWERSCSGRLLGGDGGVFVMQSHESKRLGAPRSGLG